MADEDQVPPVEDAPQDPPAPEVPAIVDPPIPTWDDLVGSLGLEPHEIAFKLLQDHGAPSLTARPATFAGWPGRCGRAATSSIPASTPW